jgi:hypothetical protein
MKDALEERQFPEVLSVQKPANINRKKRQSLSNLVVIGHFTL